MGHWDDYDDNWNYYRPAQPIRIEGGLKARSKYGAIGSTWWSRRWIGVLESFSMGNRLTRGRLYARQGQVISIEIEPGEVQAKVQGSQPKPYAVKIRLKPLTDQQWEQVIDAMAAQALFAARLLAGEMPQNIEEAFSATHLSLFPTAVKDLVTSCTCPDWANPCKHVAAVYYLLAERFDEDPFLIFKLRGRSKDEIIQSLRARRTTALPSSDAASIASNQTDQSDAGTPLEERLETFWQAGEALDSFAIRPGAPGIERAVLKRLGAAPFVIQQQNLSVLLERAYAAVDVALAEQRER